MKRLLKIILFSALFFAFCSLIMLLFFMFSKSFNIVYVRIMSSFLFSLSLIFIVVWNLYTDDVGYRRLEKLQVENGCYKAAKPMSSISGIIIFCADLNKPHLRTYVDYHTELGYNKERNHWNNPQNIDMPHEFIGYDKNDEITIINTIPYGYSCFSNRNNYRFLLNNYLKICICRDNYQNEEYFKKAVCGALVNLCSSLCKKYNLKVDKIILDTQLDNSINGNTCTEWFSQNHYSIDQLRFDVKSKNTPIMLFADEYFKVLQWFKKSSTK